MHELKIAVELVGRRGVARPSAACHGGADFHAQGASRRASQKSIERAIVKCRGGPGRGAEVHRRSQNDPIVIGRQGYEIVHAIVYHTASQLVASTARQATCHGFVANPEHLRDQAFLT